ncbi:MAG: hemerythrin domain-containing protein [Ferrimicrobium sp.]
MAELVAYLADEVLPHALAEEHTIYQVASVRLQLVTTVTEMINEHRSLATAIEQLARTSEGAEAANRGVEIGSLFQAHVTKENDLLLPSLLADEEVDLMQLLKQMQRITEAAHEETSFVKGAS